MVSPLRIVNNICKVVSFYKKKKKKTLAICIYIRVSHRIVLVTG